MARKMDEGDRYDVAIVGGGLSGLYAATLLAKQGKSVILLEAKNRLGGRTETVEYQGRKFDVGAQWVGPVHLQPRLNRLIEELGFKVEIQHSAGKGLLFFDGQKDEYEGEVSNVEGLADYDRIIDKMDQLALSLPETEPWNHSHTLDEIKDFPTPHHWIEAMTDEVKVREIIESSIRCLLTSEPEELSWFYFLWFLKCGGGYATHSDTLHAAQHSTVIGGTQQISNEMGSRLQKSANVKICLSSPVTLIRSHRIPDTSIVDFVDVVYNDTSNKMFNKITCRSVIISCPPVMCNRIMFEPPLPASRDVLQQRMRMGAVIKVFVTYQKPFWREMGYSGEIFTSGSPICNYYDASSSDGSNYALIGFIAGRDALDASSSGSTPEIRREAVISQLEKLIGPQARDLATGYLEKNWMEEEWSRGGYMGVLPPNVLRNFGKFLTAPNNRIFWAGTESADKWMGYMEGALESAERAVDQLESMDDNEIPISRL
eukprot:TRINITY_DN7711_c0_g1_i1.p1 TRINITY_DN7711_c0_g1~~TRINITY_DN7711_c0_g1_i1.p1  ORF type:complete len:486 (+),score=154.30 TRINITY_DN7711_c0_g1_i1:81-1538(+)